MNKKTTAAALIAGAVFALAGASAANAAETTPSAIAQTCAAGTVSATWNGGGSFTAHTSDKNPAGCGVWLSSYSFDTAQPTSAADHHHAQTAKEWTWAILTNTAQTFTIALPACGTYQADMYYGAQPALKLPDGELGGAYIAGNVVMRDACPPPVVVPDPTPTPTPTTPAPTPTPTTPVQLPVTVTPAPIPAAAVTPPSAAPVADAGKKLAYTGGPVAWGLLWFGIPAVALGAALMFRSRRNARNAKKAGA
ncbi:hypothetical protein [Frigoribacterium sp. UYMn621]|uniref:hypothetical protein n=1 Tax=Frigoribacterium sp. UYMn621 TaxID=3156343 RepID=UPI0033916B76